MMFCTVLRLLLLLSLYSSVIGSDPYGYAATYSCPVCLAGEVCAGPTSKKLCVKPEPVGKRCGYSPHWICESGLTCEEGLCKIVENGDCSAKGSLCVNGTVCVGSDTMKKCMVVKSRGMSCLTPFVVCERGLSCEMGFCKVGKGGDCKQKSSVCVGGTVCAGTDAEKKCVLPRTVRKRCGQDPFAVCEKHLTCEEGICKNVKGGDCSAPNSLCVDDTTCAGTENMKRCVTPIDVRKRCGQNPFSVCKKGLVCEDGLCKIKNGGDCSGRNALCTDDTVCAGTDGMKRCVAPKGVRMRCEENPFSVCKKGDLSCEEGFCKIPRGEDCGAENSLCVDETICAGGEDLKRCVLPKNVRMSCGQDLFSVCKKGLVCEEGFCKIPKGGYCIDKSSLCVDDTVCAGTDTMKKCVTPVDVRKQCGQHPFSACKKGLVCEEGFCKVRKGGDCSVKNSLCVGDTTCAGRDAVRKCMTLKGMGEPCGNDDFSVCEVDLKCVSGFCRRPKVPVGGSCLEPGSVCVDGSQCIGTVRKKLCMKQVAMGEQCEHGPLLVCEHGLRCIGRMCSKLNIQPGGDCGRKGSICSPGAVCTGTVGKKRCVRFLPIGDRCRNSLFQKCRSGLKCVNGICSKLNIPLGGNCWGKGSVCTNGTVCAGIARRKRCVKPRLAGYRCGENDVSVCETGLKCQDEFCRLPKGSLCEAMASMCEMGTKCARSRGKKRCIVVKGLGKRCRFSDSCRQGQICEKGVCTVEKG